MCSVDVRNFIYNQKIAALQMLAKDVWDFLENNKTEALQIKTLTNMASGNEQLPVMLLLYRNQIPIILTANRLL